MRLPPRVVQIFSLCSKNGALALSGHGIQSQNCGAFNRGLKSRASTIFPATAPFIALCIQTLEHVMRRIFEAPLLYHAFVWAHAAGAVGSFESQAYFKSALRCLFIAVSKSVSKSKKTDGLNSSS